MLGRAWRLLSPLGLSLGLLHEGVLPGTPQAEEPLTFIQCRYSANGLADTIHMSADLLLAQHLQTLASDQPIDESRFAIASP